jgi:molybdate transport system substrate-binding protein
MIKPFTTRRRLLSTLLAALLCGGLALPAAPAAAKDLLVFAAASLKNALDDIDASYRKDTGKGVTVSFAASSALAKQIEAGAPADVFISADLDWMDYVAQRNLIKPATRSNFLGNTLVLVAPADSKVTLTIGRNFPLAAALGGGRLALADPGAVPAGKYGKAALEALGVWSSVADKIAPAPDVRAALVLVARGETPLGIVYQTDAAADKAVKTVGTFPADTHPPIIYPIAITASSTHPDAQSYVAFLKSDAAKPAFEKQGFVRLP